MTPEALELQENAVEALLALVKSKKEEITFKAPTGSGKTRMMAHLMDAVFKEENNTIFLVSTLSKAKLAEQNFERFKELADKCICPRLKPLLIESGAKNAKNTEYSLHIDESANVYVLPSNQYTKSSRIYKEKTLLRFLEDCNKKGKKIILVRDEAHIKTNNLENELNGYFSQTIHFSATPKNEADVCIEEREAEEAGLIKRVKFEESQENLEEDLNKALEMFKKQRQVYLKQGIRPCFIVQISNEKKAKEEAPLIKRVVEEKGLQWVYFVEKEGDYESNSRLSKVKNKALWQHYVKENDSFIDVVIFKMVITEGFDMPRACMLYQVRDSQSKQLDKQVIGRVRRNPALGFFEKLDEESRKIFNQAVVWGVHPPAEKPKKVWLKGQGNLFGGGDMWDFSTNEIVKEFRPFKITLYHEVPCAEIDILDCLDESADYLESVFESFKKINKSDEKLKQKYAEYVKNDEDFFVFVANLDAIQRRVKAIVEDYANNLSVQEVELRNDVYSFYGETDFKFHSENWIWASENDEFGMDSKAEKEWGDILKSLKQSCKSIEINGEKVYLFGKNFIQHSNIKYEYYDTQKRTSFPDFIFKDKQERVHIFEVKSLEGKGVFGEEYKNKIKALKSAYQYASLKTGYIFYIPIFKGENWHIHCYENGREKMMNKEEFKKWMGASIFPR